jgi:hypothetical protein
MKFAKTNEFWYYDDDGEFAKQVDAIFRAKWKRAMEAGSLVTNTMADQIRRESIKQALKEFKAEHGDCVPL